MEKTPLQKFKSNISKNQYKLAKVLKNYYQEYFIARNNSKNFMGLFDIKIGERGKHLSRCEVKVIDKSELVIKIPTEKVSYYNKKLEEDLHPTQLLSPDRMPKNDKKK